MVFPEPERPMSARNSPRLTSTLTPLSAGTSAAPDSKTRTNSRALMMGAASVTPASWGA